ncbi:MAG TPA: chemotaxis protein CheB [Candidatus Solibacter sp.]|nr:chemotaxis protein CheB [Candidatus Solibacter sp.]
MAESPLTSGERLRRGGQEGPSTVANLIVIGASAGGHQALLEIVKSFPADMPAAIVVILHMPVGSAYHLKEYLGAHCRLPIVEVGNQEILRQGSIFIPPPGKTAAFSSGMITVGHEIPTRTVSTINRLFTSAAQSYGEGVIGVVLTGLLRDGTDGLRVVHEKGGLTVVQNPDEAEYADMPANAMEKLEVTFCLNVADIGPALELLVRRTARFETGLEVAIRTLRDRVALLVRLAAQSWRNPGTRSFLENELALLRCEIHSIDNLLNASLSGEE